MPATGVLLLNLGTPDDPTPEAVGRYLRQFLMDGLVIDIPAPLRWFLVNVLIVPRRKHASSEAYHKVWTERGSPLLFHTADLTAKVETLLEGRAHVEFGMRYGNPSIEAALEKLRKAGAEQLVVLPLYPQYSLAATKSSVVETEAALERMGWKPQVRFIQDFPTEKGFLDSFEERIRDTLKDREWDHLLFSFHGLPERQVQKTDPTGQHCLRTTNCCEVRIEANRLCYRAQCFQTAHALAQRLAIPAGKYSVSFQSRLGRAEWIKPYTDHQYMDLPKKGVRKLAVACPAFVADCLETLEEISMRGKQDFIQAGGQDLFLIPSLNSSDTWARAVVGLVQV